MNSSAHQPNELAPRCPRRRSTPGCRARTCASSGRPTAARTRRRRHTSIRCVVAPTTRTRTGRAPRPRCCRAGARSPGRRAGARTAAELGLGAELDAQAAARVGIRPQSDVQRVAASLERGRRDRVELRPVPVARHRLRIARRDRDGSRSGRRRRSCSASARRSRTARWPARQIEAHAIPAEPAHARPR